MKYWFIVHDRESYNERNDLIGFSASRNDPSRPHLNAVNEMKPGDQFIYYMKAPESAILGTFEILEGFGNYYDKWQWGIFQFRVKKLDVIENAPIPIQDLIPKLEFFKGFGERSWPYKLRTAVQSVSNADYSIVENILKERLKIQEETESEESTLKASQNELLEKPKHIQMVFETHDFANTWKLYSYVGKKEQKQVYEGFAETNLGELPEWLATIAKEIGYYEQISQIDNLWFMQEEGNFLIPIAAFEHERSRDYRAIFDRFNSLKEVLNKNRRFKNIKPKYFIIVPDKSDYDFFQRKIKQAGSWRAFSEENTIKILTIDEVKNHTKNFISLIDESKEFHQQSYYNL